MRIHAYAHITDTLSGYPETRTLDISTLVSQLPPRLKPGVYDKSRNYYSICKSERTILTEQCNWSAAVS